MVRALSGVFQRAATAVSEAGEYDLDVGGEFSLHFLFVHHSALACAMPPNRGGMSGSNILVLAGAPPPTQQQGNYPACLVPCLALYIWFVMYSRCFFAGYARTIFLKRKSSRALGNVKIYLYCSVRSLREGRRVPVPTVRESCHGGSGRNLYFVL